MTDVQLYIEPQAVYVCTDVATDLYFQRLCMYLVLLVTSFSKCVCNK